MDIAGKLQLKPGMSMEVVGPPPELDLGIPIASGEADGLLLFAQHAAELEDGAPRVLEAVAREALTWVAYPKAGKLGTDLNRDIVRETLEARGARTVRLISLDETWSALRLR